MRGTCEGCKHWDASKTDWYFSIRLPNVPGETPEQADERARRAESLYGACQAITLQDRYEEAHVLPMAFTRDGSDYRADLFTQATFGCALWEAKP